MRLTGVNLLLLTITCLFWYVETCEPNQTLNGCKIYGSECICGFGCKTEYVYRTRRACLSALRERSTNICFRQPCVRGICIQTVQEPGFACKCEGTGYYGQRCEKGCELNQTHYGCQIKESMCTCGYGCKTEYMYRTRRICLKALLLNRSDICNRQLCIHGVCIPMDKYPGYFCKCDGTKHYGKYCEKDCSTFEEGTVNFPRSCVN